MLRSHFLVTPLALVAGQNGSAGAPQLAALERKFGGRLGVSALDTGSGRHVAYRAHERFPMCSTFKLLAVAAVLTRVQEGNEDLGRRVAFSQAALLAYAPITRARLAHGYTASMSIAELCAAAIEWSDNTAANLLLHSLLGPAGVTRYARSIGDRSTRLDRNEPTLNTAIPGDPRDTTTPAAMAQNMQTIVLGTVLQARLRTRLREWLLANETGALKLRAGLPAGWPAGDKTGSGDHNTSNDVALVWPPGRKPIVIAAYYTASRANDGQQDATLAAIARIARQAFGL